MNSLMLCKSIRSSFAMRNIAASDEHRSRDWSSNGARECLATGARAFGWLARPPASGRRQEGTWSIGQGMACAYYPVFQAPAAARVRIDSEGRVTLFCGNQDIGTGSLTVMVQAVARELGVASRRYRGRVWRHGAPRNTNGRRINEQCKRDPGSGARGTRPARRNSPPSQGECALALPRDGGRGHALGLAAPDRR